MHCLSSEFNSEPKVKNTFEHPTREGKCAGTPANGLQKGKKKKEEEEEKPLRCGSSGHESRGLGGVVLMKWDGMFAQGARCGLQRHGGASSFIKVCMSETMRGC